MMELHVRLNRDRGFCGPGRPDDEWTALSHPSQLSMEERLHGVQCLVIWIFFSPLSQFNKISL